MAPSALGSIFILAASPAATGLDADARAWVAFKDCHVSSRYAKKVKTGIPADQLERAQARVDQLLELLRSETQRLAPDAGSALTFSADQAE